MRYDDRDDYNNRYGSRDSRSRSSSSSSYDSRGSSSRSSRDSYRSGSGYDRSGRDSYRSGGSYGSYDDRYDRGYGYSDYDRRYSQPYDRYGGRTRSFDNFDEENWRRTAPNWVDHSEPDPPPRRRTTGSPWLPSALQKLPGAGQAAGQYPSLRFSLFRL